MTKKSTKTGQNRFYFILFYFANIKFKTINFTTFNFQ